MKKKVIIAVIGVIVLAMVAAGIILLATPRKADIIANLSAVNITEQDENIPFTVLISRKAKSITTAAIEVDGDKYTGEIPVGEKQCTILVPNPYKDDIYSGDQTVKAKITGVTGENIGNVNLQNSTAEVTVAEVTDTTTVEIATEDILEGDPCVTFTLTLSNATKTDACVTVDVEGEDYDVDIEAGETTGVLEVKNTNTEDNYDDASTMTGTVTAFDGGSFEDIDFSKATATAKIRDSVNATKVELTTADVTEGDSSIIFTVTLATAAKKDATITIDVAGTEYTVKIAAGSTSGVLVVMNPNGEDPYLDASSLTAKVINVSGGGFESLDYTNATATAKINDTIDNTKATLTAADAKEGSANVVFTLTLSNEAKAKVEATVDVDGQVYTITIPSGKTTGTLEVANKNTEDPYLDASKVIGKLTKVTGGNFESILVNKDPVTLNVADTIDTTTVNLSANDVKEGTAYIVFTVSLSNAAQTDTDVAINVGGTSHNVTIGEGSSSTTLSVANTNTEDPYKDASTLTGKVTSVTGGNFEAVDYSNASKTVNITDTTDTTTVSFTAKEAHEGDAFVEYTVSLSNKAQTKVTVELTVDGTDLTKEIAAGEKSVSFNIANTNTEDIYLDASTQQGLVTSVTGGNFEAVDYSNAKVTANILDTINATDVTISTKDIQENDSAATFTLTLGNPGETDVTVTVNANGSSRDITFAAGKTSETFDVTNTNGEDPYKDESEIVVEVVNVTGGNFEKVNYNGVKATAKVADTIDTTTVSLSAKDTVEGTSFVEFTVSLSNPAQTDAKVTLSAGGKNYTKTIVAGNSEATIQVANPNTEDFYTDASTLTGTVTAVSGGNFEQVDFSSAAATANIADTLDKTDVQIEGKTAYEGDANITFVVTTGGKAKAPATVEISVDGLGKYSRTIQAGNDTATFQIQNPRFNDNYYKDGDTSVAGEITSITGGGFEDFNVGPSSELVIHDNESTTKVTLTAASYHSSDTQLTYTVTLSQFAQTQATATVRINNADHTVTIAAGSKTGTLKVENKSENRNGVVTGVTGGNFEKIDITGAGDSAELINSVSISGSNITEGEDAVFTLTLDHAAQTKTEVEVSVYRESDKSTNNYKLQINAGETSGKLTVPCEDNVYKDTIMTAKITGITGGEADGWEGIGNSVNITVADNVDTVSIYMSKPQVKEDNPTHVTFLITVTNMDSLPDGCSLTVDVDIGGNKERFIITGATNNCDVEKGSDDESYGIEHVSCEGFEYENLQY